MLRLAILRHAEAVPIAEGGDPERPLTSAGHGMAERMGRYFKNNDLVPDFAFVSPARRAQETFEGLERGAGQSFKAKFVLALYNASIEMLSAVAEAVPDEIKFLLLVGHNPGFAEFANALAGTGKKAELAKMREHFSTPCLAIIDFDVESWPKAMTGNGHLEIFLTRAALAKLPPGDKR
jgi:phosphohistidine phosphatase